MSEGVGVRGSTRGLVVAAATGVLLAGMVAAPPAQAAGAIVVWSDPAHAAALSQLTAAGYKGTPVTIVVKDPATVRSDLAGVAPADAPDVIWGDLAWTGELASAGTIVPLDLTKKRRAEFRPNVLAGANVAGDTYGLPVQISNLALVSNTQLVPQQPTTFGALSDMALKLKKDKKARIPFALPQSEGTSPYTTYPLFSGVGGYLFARSADGSLDTGDVGLASVALKQNASLIDDWNASGLIDSSLTADRARAAFANGKSAFILAGPEDLAYLLSLTFPYRIGAVPPIVKGLTPAPLLTIHGLMLTSWAARHGVQAQAQGLVGRLLSRPRPQQVLAAAQGWYPANTGAAETVPTGGGRIRAIGNAGVAGVPMPNAPEAGTLWAPYATAWAASTSGDTATPAKRAFRIAQRAVVSSLSGGTSPAGNG